MPAINLNLRQLRTITREVERADGRAAITETAPIDNVRVAEGFNGHAFTLYATSEIVSIFTLDRDGHALEVPA